MFWIRLLELIWIDYEWAWIDTHKNETNWTTFLFEVEMQNRIDINKFDRYFN